MRRNIFFLFLFLAPFSFAAVAFAQATDQPLFLTSSLSEKDSVVTTSEGEKSVQNELDTLTDKQKKELLSGLKSLPNTSPAPTGTINCFDYYHFGSVQVDVSPTLSATVPGTTIGFSGQIKNTNDYPIVSGEVYAKIFFKKTQDESLSHQNGYALIDQFMVKEDLSLAAKGVKDLSFTWIVPNAAETGDYQIAFYFTSAKRYNLLGLSFTDDVTGNTADFKVLGATDTAISFDKNAVTLGGKEYAFAAFPPRFTQDESVVVKTKLTNPKDEDIAVSVTWKLYAWDGLREEALRDIHEEVVFIKAQSTETISYTAEPIDTSVSYLVVEAKDHDMKSLLDIRFIRDGIEETRMNFPSIATYPLQKGEEATLFSCAHSTNQPIVKDNILTLTLRDEAGRTIHTYRYEGDITGEMMGLKDTFIPKKTYTNFSLTATLERDGQVTETVTQKYGCQEIDQMLCPKVGVDSMSKIVIGKRTSLALAVTLIFFLGVLFWKLWKDKKENLTRILSFLLMVVVSGTLFFGGASGAEAKSVVWTGGPYSRAANIVWSDYITMDGAMVSVQYNALAYRGGVALSDGSSVTSGDTITFSAPYSNTDISWFATGRYWASPYGYWNSGGSQCNPSNQYAYIPSGMGVSLFAQTIINRSGVSASGSGMSCSGLACTVTGTGSVTGMVNFAPTTGRVDVEFALGAGCWGSRFGLANFFNLNVPAQSIPFTFTVVSSNNPPTPPIITGPTTGNASTNYAFSLLSSDPNNDTLRYGIDWDNNSTVDQWVPAISYVPSNTTQSASHIWPASGTYTFKALAQDSKGMDSGWTSHVITIAPAPTLTFIATPTTLPYTGGTTTLSWVTTGTSCWASNGWSGWQVTSGSVSKIIAASTIFSLECWNDAGVSTGLQSVLVTVATPPLPTVEFLINGSSGPLSLTRGDARNFTWITSDATSCTAASSDGWSGSKITPNGSESLPANITSNHTLTCTGPGGTVSKSVLVNVSCVPATGAYGACDCPTETKTRSNLLANCTYVPETTNCDADEKNACRDFNWKEIAP